ncbi:hypothetical protein BTVI_43594 [Pitangus sulphuratus]|nr:hypothetical protein BTVI_43594 [Pitangus sulphuratus]
MGNEVSHEGYGCRMSRRLKRLPAEQKPTAPDVPLAQPAVGAVLGGRVTHPGREKPQDAAPGMQREDPGGESGTASCSLPEAQRVGRSTELQEFGEAGNQPPEVNPDGQTAQEGPAAAHQGEGDPEVTTMELPLQPAEEMGAEQGAGKSSSVVLRKPSKRVCRPSPLCRWLKKLESPAGKPEVKPGGVTGQE